eukprot:Gb_05232 [translate_table: standard]
MSELRAYDEEDLYTIISSTATYSAPSSILDVDQSMVEPNNFCKKRSWNDANSIPMSSQLLHHQSPMSFQKTPSHRQMHGCTERVRRANMNSMLTTLHSLLPDFPRKADKITIVDEAINYIKSLQLIMKDLEEKRSKMEITSDYDDSVQNPMIISKSSCVNIVGSNVAGNHVFLTIMCSGKAGIVPKIFQVLNENGMEIEEVTISPAGFSGVLCAIHAIVANKSSKKDIVKAMNELTAISIPKQQHQEPYCEILEQSALKHQLQE